MQKHKWAFRARFRANSFGWRSQPAIQRIKEAVTEIKKVAKTDPVLGAEGAVLFLESVSPALEQVDSSSGAIGGAVNYAIENLAAIIERAPAEDSLRKQWLERLFEAIQEDQMPYIEYLNDFWGDMCVTSDIASEWADRLIGTVRHIWSDDSGTHHYFCGTTLCLGALFKAGRYHELLDLLKLKERRWWHFHVWGSRALAAMGQVDEAIQYAKSCDSFNDHAFIARECEKMLLEAGRSEEAFEDYAFQLSRHSTHLATFRAVAKKYPKAAPGQILQRLVENSPGEEGKWFAAAKSAGLYEFAAELAKHSPCDPRTLTRAARDFAEKQPLFAVSSGIAALYWIGRGYGYEISERDVSEALQYTLDSARNAQCVSETIESIREIGRSTLVIDTLLNRLLSLEPAYSG
ncbi:hypothetical protein HQ496_02920 [bacterium]|nr:hypothetical protein [bacterium]